MMMMIFVLNCKSKAYLAFEFIQASTFNPFGSLSSTEDIYTTTKNENCRKVKVRKITSWNSTSKILLLNSPWLKT